MEGAHAIAETLSKLTSINLGHCEIGIDGAKLVAVISRRSILTVRSLEGNHFDVEGAEAIAAGLPQSMLTSLDLSNNSLTYEDTNDLNAQVASMHRANLM